MLRRILPLLLVLAAPGLAHAQTVISVPLNTGTLAWDEPVATATTSLPTQYVVTCGSQTTIVPAPATSIPVRNFVSGPGSYTCTIRAENGFGRSSEVDVPAFMSGYVPGPPFSIRLEVR